MRRDFRDRDELLAYLREKFPWAEGGLSPFVGGRAAAEEKLVQFPALQYAESRNFLDGAVSRLSPYIRHGVVTLREVRGQHTGKFVMELAWRDYFQRIYKAIGNGVWEDREPAKVNVQYQDDLPEDLGGTGLACMDGFVADLVETGYLHNHARLWLAAYLVHWRRVRWQTGAGWFLKHLVDGDPASNNLSWQWVASTFSVKPYIFNQENLELFTGGRYCHDCSRRESCPFDKSYEELTEELF